MKNFTTNIAIVCLAILFSASLVPPVAAATLKAGDPAPNFELPGSDGRTYKLSDFKGKQAVLIAWFPKAFTGG